MSSEKLNKSAFGIQVLATICISFLAVQTGLICAWPSYTVEMFQSNETILSRPMTSIDISLLGGLPNIGGLVTSPFCGYVFNKIGRKYATIIFGVPYLHMPAVACQNKTKHGIDILVLIISITWFIIILSNSVPLILFATVIAGIGIAGQNVSLIYISEISHDSIRGGLTAFTASGYFLGILISYVLGGYLNYYHVVYTCIALCVLCMLCLMFLKESPVYLMLIGNETEAANSIAFYNQVEVTSVTVQKEIKKLKIQMDPRLEKILDGDIDIDTTEELMESMLGDMVVTSKESPWRLFLKSKSSKRALTTVLMVIVLTIAMGSVVMQVYAEKLFKEAVPSMTPNTCAIILAVDYLVASIICVFIIDKFGRKHLLLVASALSGICTVLLGAQLQKQWAPHWVTAALIYLYSFIYTVGCAVIPFVLAAEVYLPEVRSFCNSISMAFVWAVTFVTLFVFNPVAEAVGLAPVFYCFSVICFLGTLYTHLRVPETKGLSADEIQALFLKIK